LKQFGTVGQKGYAKVKNFGNLDGIKKGLKLVIKNMYDTGQKTPRQKIIKIQKTQRRDMKPNSNKI